MRSMIVTLIVAFAAIGAGSVSSAAVENCRTGDSALCAADPNCHWNFARRGCYQYICNADTAIGCKWNSDGNRCEQAK